ncbi:hypothetical protein GCM10023339_25680 [Alloalcanivorax gelatiniphagus]
MRRSVPVHLSPDEHCAVHHFIRVHGRRPTPDELRRELEDGERHLPAHVGSPGALVSALRREVARVLVRL